MNNGYIVSFEVVDARAVRVVGVWAGTSILAITEAPATAKRYCQYVRYLPTKLATRLGCCQWDLNYVIVISGAFKVS